MSAVKKTAGTVQTRFVCFCRRRLYLKRGNNRGPVK